MRRWLTRLAVPAAIVAAGLFSLSPAAWATAPTPVKTTVTWTGNGTTDGTCDNIGSFDDLNPGPNQQGWLFILTSPFDNTGSDLTFLFNPTSAQNDSTSPVAGVLQGNGSYHFVVYSSIGAKLVSASATNGTQTSVLTVSHCEQGSSTPPPTTTPPATTTPPVTTSSPGTSTTPGVPSSTSGGGSHLPTTGIALTGFIVAGLALIGGGLAALMIARRRNDANPTEI